jgi:hypothetical protein
VIGVTANDPSVIYTGSTDGELWSTRRSETTWLRLNDGLPSLPAGSITALRARDTDAYDLLVGVSSGPSHLWRCVDTRASVRSWINVSGSGQTALPDLPIYAIERDPSNPQSTWFVGTDIGVFRTTNAGNTWQNISEPLGLPNVRVVSLKIRDNHLCAVTNGRGLWRLRLDDPGDGRNLILLGFEVTPQAVVGPALVTGKVTLSGPAPPGGQLIAVTGTSRTQRFQQRVLVLEGQTSRTFPMLAKATPSQVVLELTATLNSTRAVAELTVNPDGLTGITVTPTSVVGGTACQGSVSVSSPAPAGGAEIALSSTDPSVASLPSSVTIPAGQNSAGFTVSTVPTQTDAMVTIRANYGASTVSTQLTVRAPKPVSLTLSAGSVVGGNIVRGTFTLDGKAPSGGAAITLASSDPAAASVPATVTIPANSTSVDFDVTTHSVLADRTVVISGDYGSITKTASLTVLSQNLASLTFNPNPVLGGQAVTGTVALAGPSVGNTVVTLSSNSAAASVPPSVTIPNGSTSVDFQIQTSTVQVDTAATVFASAGVSSVQATLTVQPLRLVSFSLSSSAAFEGQNVTGTVAINGPAPAGGVSVQLSQTNPTAATIPASVSIPQGQSSASFTITGKSVTSQQSTTITASRAGVTFSRTLTVSPITISSFQLTNSSVTGGTVVQAVIQIVAPAPPGGYSIALSSSNSGAASVPSSVTIPSGASSAIFDVTTRRVTQVTFVTLTATHGASVRTVQIQVNP